MKHQNARHEKNCEGLQVRSPCVAAGSALAGRMRALSEPGGSAAEWVEIRMVACSLPKTESQGAEGLPRVPCHQRTVGAPGTASIEPI